MSQINKHVIDFVQMVLILILVSNANDHLIAITKMVLMSAI